MFSGRITPIESILSYQASYEVGKNLIIIHEAKEDVKPALIELVFLDEAEAEIEGMLLYNYGAYRTEHFLTNRKVLTETEFVVGKTNGLRYTRIDYNTEMENEDETVCDFLIFIEGRERVYYVHAYTSPENKDEYSTEVKKMIKSFKEQ